MTNIAYDVTNQALMVGDVVMAFRRVSTVTGKVVELQDNGNLVIEEYVSAGWDKDARTVVAANRCILLMSVGNALRYSAEGLRDFYGDDS